MKKPALLAVLFLSLAGSVNANLIINGGFEDPVLGSPFAIIGAGASLGGWSVVGPVNSNILLLRHDYTEGALQFPPRSGLQSLDLTGAFNTGAVGVAQTVAVIPGVDYLLSFAIGNQDNAAPDYPLASSYGVFINDINLLNPTHSASTPNIVNWSDVSFVWTAPAGVTSATIRFTNTTPVEDNYAGLDDVTLVAQSAVHEPATFTLLAAGIAAIIARKFAKIANSFMIP